MLLFIVEKKMEPNIYIRKYGQIAIAKPTTPIKMFVYCYHKKSLFLNYTLKINFFTSTN